MNHAEVKHLITLVNDLVNSSSNEGCTDDLIVCDAAMLKPLAEFTTKLKKQLEVMQDGKSQPSQVQQPALPEQHALTAKLGQFLGQLAGLRIWSYDMEDGTPYKECDEPSDGFLDSHTCLMETILEARALNAELLSDQAHWVIYSPNESSLNDGAGFWCNTDGWTELEGATKFTPAQSRVFTLPMATGQDARWVDVRTLCAASREMAEVACNVSVSVDGGQTFTPAPNGVRVIYKGVPIPGEDLLGELHINATHEGLITDIWATRDEPLDHNIGTESVPTEDTVFRLIENNA